MEKILVMVWLLAMARAKAHTVTAEQAVEAVRQFCGDANLTVSVVAFRVDEPDLVPGGYYDLEAQGNPWTGSYEVRATDGRVIEMMLDDPEPDVATLTRDQAQASAEQFLRQHYQRFDQCKWFVWPAKYGNNGPVFDFAWSEVLNQYGVLAPHEVKINVNGVTGRVTLYFEPSNKITGPTVPQITRDQAIKIASPYAICDPAAVPFSEIYLQLSGSGEDQSLVWMLMQFPDPEQGDLDFGVYVDAITGEMDYTGGGHWWICARTTSQLPARHSSASQTTLGTVVRRSRNRGSEGGRQAALGTGRCVWGFWS